MSDKKFSSIRTLIPKSVKDEIYKVYYSFQELSLSVRNALKIFLQNLPFRVQLTLLLAVTSILIKYLSQTLSHPNSQKNLKKFVEQLSELVSSNLFEGYISNLLFERKRLMRSGSSDEITSLYQKAASLYPKESRIYSYWADSSFIQGKWQENRSTLLKLVKINEEKAAEQGLDRLGIRIVSEKYWGFQLGHISHLDILAKLKILGYLSPEKRIIYACLDKIPNPCYLNYWKQYFDIVLIDRKEMDRLHSFASPIYEQLPHLKMKEGYKEFYSAWDLAENSWKRQKRSPLLELNEIDKERGKKVLEQWSIPQDAWFVGLHVRETNEPSFLSARDADIMSYLPAIKAITDRGGWVIRMGNPGMKPLPPLPRTIDYIYTEYKSDWMDVFLWAACKFFLGVGSGPISVPPTFGRPVLCTNFRNINRLPDYPNSLFLPKLFWSKNENHFLSFREMLDSPFGWNQSRALEEIECDLIDNTPEEIEAGVLEMLSNLENYSGGLRELSPLQRRFNDLRKEYSNEGQMRISQTFAEKHQNLILS